MNRTSGWITGRSQIAFIVGLIVAFAVIFWMEHLRFQESYEPLGTYWIESIEVPPERSRPSEASSQIEAWRQEALAAVAMAEPQAAHTAVLLTYAVCVRRGYACAESLRERAEGALAAVAADQASAGSLEEKALMLVATVALLAEDSPIDARAAYRVLTQQLRKLTESSLVVEAGLRQFIARAVALTGHELPDARSYAELRPIFQAADGMTRLGVQQASALTRGLGLIVACFPGHGYARSLLWQSYRGWAYEDVQPLTAALWWSQFDDEQLADLGLRLSDTDLSRLPPLEAAMIFLALSAAEAGPLL